MSYSELLNRMMHRDTDAFLEMTDRYGWSLYAAIREKYPDRDTADRIYNETMNRFYSCLQNASCSDPVEALLCAFADQICGENGLPNVTGTLSTANASLLVEDNMPPRVMIFQDASKTEAKPSVKQKNKVGFWYGLGMILAITVVITVLWVIVGLLMDMNFIPYYDLGYSWLRALIAQWF